jgi:hypothetical protein
VQYDFLVNMAAFDGGIAVWQEKVRYDAVRPASAIRYLYGDGLVTAWGGPGRGTVNLPATQWTRYLGVALGTRLVAHRLAQGRRRSAHDRGPSVRHRAWVSGVGRELAHRDAAQPAVALPARAA